MDSRWKNLGIAAAALLAIAAVIYILSFTPPEPTFAQNKAGLDSLWSENGVSYFIPETQLRAIPETRLLELKNQTLDFKKKFSSKSDDALATIFLADIYTARLDVLVAWKRNDEANSLYNFTGFESDEEVCSNASALESIQSTLEELLDALQDLDARISGFRDSYPLQFEESGLSFNSERIESIQEAVGENTSLLSTIREACS